MADQNTEDCSIEIVLGEINRLRGKNRELLGIHHKIEHDIILHIELLDPDRSDILLHKVVHQLQLQCEEDSISDEEIDWICERLWRFPSERRIGTEYHILSEELGWWRDMQ